MSSETTPTDMRNPRYSILVMPNLFGQYRIQLTDVLSPDPSAPPPHGMIVRELCTYRSEVCVQTVKYLKESEDPLGFAASLATRNNCEGVGGRIRLDQ